MTARQIVGAFYSATWSTPAELEQELAGWGEFQPSEVLRLLEALLAGSGGDDPERHRFRCLGFTRLVQRNPDRSLFAPLVKALKAPDAVLREAIAEALPSVNSVSDHPALCLLLREQDPALRQLVARILAKLGGKNAFDVLAELVAQAGFVGRLEAMEALAAVGEQRAIPALQVAFKFGSPREKVAALDLIAAPRCSSRTPEAAIRALALALEDAAEPVVVHALGGLSRLAGDQEYLSLTAPVLASTSLEAVRAAVDGLKRYPLASTLPVLLAKLRDGPRVVRLSVVDVLESIGTGAAVDPLVNALGHRQLAVRIRAAEALARLGRAGKLDLPRTIVWLLRSRDVNVRRMAVELAHSSADRAEELWPKLLACLRDEDWWVRERVADALVDLAGEQIVRPVAAYLQDPAPLVRRFAIDVLRRVRAPEALGALVHSAGEDEDWWVREGAIEAIAALKDPQAIPYLLDILLREPDLSIACLQALADIGSTEAAPRVAALLESKDGDVRMAALQCLSTLDDPEQGPAVQPLLRDAVPAIRALARGVLARWKAAAQSALETVNAQGLSPLDQLLLALARMEGDDLILIPDRPPLAKRFGRILPLARNIFSEDTLRKLLIRHLSVQQLLELESPREVDFSYEVKTEGLRFRANVFRQRAGLSAVFRIIKGALPRLDGLGLPPIVTRLAELKHGLVLVGGPTGSGKSTTLAAMVDHINETDARHIVTFEDPIEVLHQRKLSLVNQREIGIHTGAFSKALRATLRQDPDVILIGEMRDLPTIAFAVTAAETGHLVFGTIHTVSAAMTVDRLINAFPAGQQQQVRSILAGSLRAVVCQYLLRRRDSNGRCLSVEVMLNNEAIASLIRSEKTYQIPSVVATSREAGMQLMDQELMRLVRAGTISAEDGYVKAVNKKDFASLVEGESPPA